MRAYDIYLSPEGPARDEFAHGANSSRAYVFPCGRCVSPHPNPLPEGEVNRRIVPSSYGHWISQVCQAEYCWPNRDEPCRIRTFVRPFCICDTCCRHPTRPL